MNIPHWFPWKTEEFSSSFPVPCTLWHNNFGKGRPLPTAEYTTFAYEMICITKRCVTFNKYARNFTFYNEMKTTITLSHACCVVSFSVA